MLKIEPQILLDEKKKQRGVILKPSDFKCLLETLEDYDDYKALITRKKQLGSKRKREHVLISHEEMGRMLFGKDA